MTGGDEESSGGVGGCESESCVTVWTDVVDGHFVGLH